MTGLAAALAAGPTGPKKGPGCTVGQLVAGLTGDDRAALDAAMAFDSGWTHSELARILAEQLSVKVAPNTVGRHRRGECRCESR